MKLKQYLPLEIVLVLAILAVAIYRPTPPREVIDLARAAARALAEIVGAVLGALR